MKAVAALSVLVLLLLAPRAVSQVPDDKLIVPGQRIGKWTLEMTIDQLVQMNGRRSYQGPGASPAQGLYGADHARNFSAHCWGVGQPFCAYTQDGQKIEWLRITDSEFKTEKGVASGVVRGQVEAAYGRPAAVTEPYPVDRQGAKIVRLIWDEIGLAVACTEPLPGCGGFAVFRVGTAKTLWRF